MPQKQKPQQKRIKKQRTYKSFRLAKKIKRPPQERVPYSWQLIRQTLSILSKNKRTFGGILLVYVAAVVVLRGFDISSDFSSVKETVDELVGDGAGKIGSAVGLYFYAVSAGGTDTSSAGGAYQMFAALIVSLAVIWTVRQIMAGALVRARDGFYQGMYPLVLFVMVLFVIGLQLIPLLIGSFLLSTVLENAIAVTVLEKLLWLMIFALLATLSFYMLVSSVFALYISALPDMTPLRALRSARELVRHRRLGIGIRILAAGIFLLAVSMAVVIPLIFIASGLVEWAVLILGGFSLIFLHCYLYKLYRELL